MPGEGFETFNKSSWQWRRQRRHLRWIEARTPPALPLTIEPGKRLLVFGDLHLASDARGAWEALRRFLDGLQPERTAALVCLGDLFEYYLGAAHLHSALGEARERFAGLVERGIPVFVVPGNRDFLIGKEFRDRGVAVYPHGLRLALHHGEALAAQLWIVHGDELMLDDRMHQVWSRLSRGSLARWGSAAMPVTLLDWIARRLRAASRRRRAQRAQRLEALPRVRPLVAETLLRMMNTHRLAKPAPPSAWLITGHFHVPLFERREAGTLITVGEWDGLGGVVASFALESHSPPPAINGHLVHSAEVAQVWPDPATQAQKDSRSDTPGGGSSPD